MQRLLIPVHSTEFIYGAVRVCVWFVNTSAVRLGLTHPPPLAVYPHPHPSALYRHPPTHSASFLTRLGRPDRVAQHKPIPRHHARAPKSVIDTHKRSMCFGKRPGEAETLCPPLHSTDLCFGGCGRSWLCYDLFDIDSLCCCVLCVGISLRHSDVRSQQRA